MSKFGVSYNLYEDSIELLEFSINSIRESVDYIHVTYQFISNLGEKSEKDHLPYLQSLLGEGLIDEITTFTPTQYTGHSNELLKRNIGRNYAYLNRCSHFMSMDCDELYLKDELDYAKKVILEGDHDGAACQMLTYYKSCDWILDPPETYYVPLFYKINPARIFTYGQGFPVLVDPTRRIHSTNVKIFTREEIQMHHFSYVRKNIRKKLENSSAQLNYQHIIDSIVDDYDNFDGSFANIAGGKHPVKQINPYFNVVL